MGGLALAGYCWVNCRRVELFPAGLPRLGSTVRISRSGADPEIAWCSCDEFQSVAYFAVVACVVCGVAPPRMSIVAAETGVGNVVLASAICPIVYPVDETPSGHGYQYAFYGNAFFISREGYLITAAHVLHSFSNGGEPHILVQRNDAPPVMLNADVVVVDKEHDVAVLARDAQSVCGELSGGDSFAGTRNLRHAATAWLWRH